MNEKLIIHGSSFSLISSLYHFGKLQSQILQWFSAALQIYLKLTCTCSLITICTQKVNITTAQQTTPQLKIHPHFSVFLLFFLLPTALSSSPLAPSERFMERLLLLLVTCIPKMSPLSPCANSKRSEKPRLPERNIVKM
jgi:hypothetical protein